MKHVLLISILAALSIAACGEKSNLTLKAREHQKGGRPADSSTKVDGAFVSLKEADNRILAANTRATRNVLLGDDSSEITVYCATDLEDAANEKERIKILGSGQIMMPQDDEMPIPETIQQLGSKKEEAAKAIVNILCKAPAAPAINLEKYGNLVPLVLTPGSPIEVTGKFSTSAEEVQTINIACANDAQLAAADQILFPGTGVYPVKILIGVETKLLLETSSAPKQKQKEYILVSCQAASPDSYL